jgi:uncharacterized membrane protein
MDTTPTASAGAEDKTAAILSYLTLLGFIVAIVLNNSKKTKIGIFHLRQVLGFFLTLIAVAVCQIVLVFIPILGWLAIFLLWCSMLVLWVIGLIGAIRGQMTLMPVVGPMYQKWFSNTFE